MTNRVDLRGASVNSRPLLPSGILPQRYGIRWGSPGDVNAQNILFLIYSAHTLQLAISSLHNLIQSVALNIISMPVNFKCVFPALVTPKTPNLSPTA